jgi:predicted MFS family arabinose efflux permease
VTAPAKGSAAVKIFAAFALAYFLSYALRAVNAAIAPSLVADLGLSNTQLGGLTSAYFFSFALLQLPLGFWLDKFGPRLTQTALLVFAAVGCILFAVSNDFVSLWLARAAIGIGVCACLMAALKGFRLWFAPEQHARLTSWMFTAGTLGVISSTVPAQWAAQAFGWRSVFFFVAALVVLSIGLLLWALPKHQVVTPTAQDQTASVSTFAKDPYFWRLGMLGTVQLGSFIALQTLWAGPWLTTVLGFTPAQTAQRLFAINVCVMCGYFLMGFLAPRLQLAGKNFVGTVSVVNLPLILILAAIATWHDSRAWWLWMAYMFIVGVNNLALTHVSLNYPASIAGRVSSAYNFLIFVGAFLVQWGTGAVIDWFANSYGLPNQEAYRAALWCLVALQAVSWLCFVLWRAQPRRVTPS